MSTIILEYFFHIGCYSGIAGLGLHLCGREYFSYLNRIHQLTISRLTPSIKTSYCEINNKISFTLFITADKYRFVRRFAGLDKEILFVKKFQSIESNDERFQFNLTPSIRVEPECIITEDMFVPPCHFQQQQHFIKLYDYSPEVIQRENILLRKCIDAKLTTICTYEYEFKPYLYRNKNHTIIKTRSEEVDWTPLLKDTLNYNLK